MAQTADAITKSNFKLEISTDLDSPTWTDISGAAGGVSGAEQARQNGEVYTADGDVAIITQGKREPMDLQFRIVYTETTGEAFELVRAAFEAGTLMAVRYSPAGGGSGDKMYTSANGAGTSLRCPITSCTWPEMDAADGSPALAGFTIRVPALAQSTVSS